MDAETANSGVTRRELPAGTATGVALPDRLRHLADAVMPHRNQVSPSRVRGELQLLDGARAVAIGSERLRTGQHQQWIFDLARHDRQLGWHDAPADTLGLQSGAVIAAGGSVSIATLLQRAGQDAVEAEAGASLEDSAKHYSRHAFGAQFAEVLVDPDLGTIRINRWVVAFDAGLVLNSKTALSQPIGGITFGIGMALLEETHVDAETGRIVNSNVAEYLMPVNADAPDVRAVFVANDEHNSNVLGVKSVGELPMVGVAAAIANAVFHAMGVRIRKVPIGIEDVLA